MIFASNISEQNSKNFLFNLKSEESHARFTSKDKPLLCATNPNRILYGVCFQTDDYYEIVMNNPGN